MRKGIALFMSIALLLIGSIPMLPDAQAATAKHMRHMAAHTGMPMAMCTVADHAIPKDMQDCRIECACGCHDHVDALPHLLAPHMISQIEQANTMFLRINSTHEELALSEFHLPIPLPPPERH